MLQARRQEANGVDDTFIRNSVSVLRFLLHGLPSFGTPSKHANVMATVPSHLPPMSGLGVDVSTAALPHLRVLDIGGEALGKDVLDSRAPGRSLFNIYGPTEITVVRAGCWVQSGDETTIGHDPPTYNESMLDLETLEACPIGVRGLLYTGAWGQPAARRRGEDGSEARPRLRRLGGEGPRHPQ